MGAGDDDAGEGLMGLDVRTYDPLVKRRAPAALAFDGIAKDFLLDSSGQYVAAHPVDAKVFLICRTALASIKSSRNLGQTVGNIKYIDRQRIRAQVEDAFRVALAPVVAAGEIELRSIEIDTEIRGRIAARPNYVNLVLGRNRPDDFPFV